MTYFRAFHKLHHASVFCGACGQNHEQYSHFSKRKAQEYADKKVKRCYERLAKAMNPDVRQEDTRGGAAA